MSVKATRNRVQADCTNRQIRNTPSHNTMLPKREAPPGLFRWRVGNGRTTWTRTRTRTRTSVRL